MGEVKTNNISLASTIEASLSVLPAQPSWYLQEPNDVTTFGATITTVPRNPISKNRQRRKGTTTDLDSAVEFEADFTKEAVLQYIEGYCFANATNPTINSNTNGGQSGIGNLAAAAGAYTHDALSAALPQGQLIFARAFTLAVNNGLDEVDAAGTTTNTPTVGGAQLAETPGDGVNATLEIAGFRFTDLTWTDATTTIGSALVDLTTIGLTVGQIIHVGGDPAGTNEFTGGAVRGRVVSIIAASVVLDKVLNVSTGTLQGGGDVGASAVDIHYGSFVRNLPVDDGDFIARSFQFELELPNLDNPSGDRYAYAEGNFCNTLAFNLPLTDKATLTLAFVGTDTQPPTITRRQNAATPEVPIQVAPLNTSSDIARLRITKLDEAGLTTDFKSITLTLNNNVTPEKVLGLLGAKFLNTGNFEVDLETQILFTDADVAQAVRDNETVTMDAVVRNDDGGAAIDIPAMTLGDGSPEFPVNETVLLNLAGQAFADPTLMTSIGISFFPVLP